MKFKELSQLNAKDREKKLTELELELIKLNTQVATGTAPKNSGQLKRIKKDIARIKLLKGIEENKPLETKVSKHSVKPNTSESLNQEATETKKVASKTEEVKKTIEAKPSENKEEK